MWHAGLKMWVSLPQTVDVILKPAEMFSDLVHSYFILYQYTGYITETSFGDHFHDLVTYTKQNRQADLQSTH